MKSGRTALRAWPNLARALVLLLALLFVLGAVLPRPTGWVVDEAGVLAATEREEIEAVAQRLKDATGAELAVVAVESTGGRGAKAYAVELFEAWGIGEQGKDTGVLLLLVTGDERRVEIEVGYGLEAVLTDGAAGRILDTHVVPKLQAGEIGAALVAGATAIAAHVSSGLGFEPVADSESVPPASRQGESVWPLLLIGVGGMFIWLVLAYVFRPRCPRCRQPVQSVQKVLEEPTVLAPGIAEVQRICRRCGWRGDRRRQTLPARSSAVGGGYGPFPGGGGGFGGSGSRGGFGGFGGGRSGGGGAGRSW